jgi:hypothetical protein
MWVSKKVGDGRKSSALRVSSPQNSRKVYLGVARPQGVEGLGIVGSSETLGSLCPPLAIRPWIVLLGLISHHPQNPLYLGHQGTHYHYYFFVFGIEPTLLDISCMEWKDDSSYIELGNIMSGLAVTNDAAERIVKLGTNHTLIIMDTEKPRYNKSEGTKDFVLYSRGFVIAGAFYYRINYRKT